MSQSQVHSDEVTWNLHKFAGYMKTSVITVIITIFGGVVLLICALFIWELIYFIGFVLLAVGIALFVFQILQLSSLNRAKNASPDPLLVLGFNLRLVALLVLGVAILIIFVPYLMFFLVCLSLVLTLFGYNALIKYAEKNYSSTRQTRQGFILYIVFIFIGIGSSIGALLSYDWWALIFYFLGILISFFLIILGLAALASGLLKAFTTENHLHKDQIEPTFQSYGQPKPSPQSPPSPPPEGVGKLKICTKCGTPFSEGMKFCPHCGLSPASPRSDSTYRPLSPSFPSSPSSEGVSKLQICTRCGSTIVDGSKFCGNCGLNH